MTRDIATSILTPGQMLDHYRIEAVVARGGMSELYKATDTRSERAVALKVPLPEMQADTVLVERFKREEEIGQLFDHPGIVKTFDGEERSRVYMVLQWVDGRLLRAILNEEGKLPVERSVAITLRICDALDTMHKHGVVHRDLKPENIMVDADDQIKLIDFGIAMKEDARRLTFVNLSATLGTADYIAPEQVKGQRGDQRSDIYATGIMLYEMLTGQVPFTGPSPLASMNERLLHDAPAPRDLNPEISPELQEIVFRALEREPRHRYATASEMAWDLEHQEQVGIEERVTGSAARGGRKRVKRELLLYVALATIPLVIFILMVLVAKK
ncbi:MAG TPA: serine/threonine-protein kinase [Terracidiphilus sp.]|nr:serine/threonine-protein kinase [Terracidiphilus sp.]